MYEVVDQPRTGWSVVSDGTHAVALDTTLTPALELEGAARELVRAINEQRKAIGLDLSDRVDLELDLIPAALGDDLASASLLDLIAREVLADTVERVASLAEPTSDEPASADAETGADASPGADVAQVAQVVLGELGTARIRVTRA